jgi:hypothetical protein
MISRPSLLFIAALLTGLLVISSAQKNSKNIQLADEPEAPQQNQKKEEVKEEPKDPFAGLIPNCELNQRNCIPLNNFTFFERVPTISVEEQVQEHNRKLQEKKYAVFPDIQFKVKSDGRIGLFATKKISKKTRILTVPFSDALTSDALDLGLFGELPDDLKLLKYFKLPSYEVRNKSIDNFISSQFLQYSTQVLLHLYNPTLSKFKHEIASLPRDLSVMPVLDLDKDEIEALDEATKNKILNERFS